MPKITLLYKSQCNKYMQYHREMQAMTQVTYKANLWRLNINEHRVIIVKASKHLYNKDRYCI